MFSPMPSNQHETLIHMFVQRPELAAELLTQAMGVNLPRHRAARLDSPAFTALTPTEFRADAVVVLTKGETAVAAIIVEVQLTRDRSKRRSWPVYLATLHARLSCPTLLLVVCADEALARWCATPIDLGHPGWLLTPLVVGPRRVPLVTDHGTARRVPELAVLSAIAHATPTDRRVLDALLAALESVDEKDATPYSDFVMNALPEAARRYLEAMLSTGTYEYQTEFVRRYVFQGRAEGRVEGEARAVLGFLEARKIVVPDDARERIMACSDLAQLDDWVRRAATADCIDDLFV
jgi:hypothetical protein